MVFNKKKVENLKKVDKKIIYFKEIVYYFIKKNNKN